MKTYNRRSYTWIKNFRMSEEERSNNKMFRAEGKMNIHSYNENLAYKLEIRGERKAARG